MNAAGGVPKKTSGAKHAETSVKGTSTTIPSPVEQAPNARDPIPETPIAAA